MNHIDVVSVCWVSLMDEVENSLNQLFQYLVMPHSFILSDTNLNFVNLTEFSVHSKTK